MEGAFPKDLIAALIKPDRRTCTDTDRQARSTTRNNSRGKEWIEELRDGGRMQ